MKLLLMEIQTLAVEWFLQFLNFQGIQIKEYLYFKNVYRFLWLWYFCNGLLRSKNWKILNVFQIFDFLAFLNLSLRIKDISNQMGFGCFLTTLSLLLEWSALNIWSWSKSYFESFENFSSECFLKVLTVNFSKVSKLK